jgi:hypothetical protein
MQIPLYQCKAIAALLPDPLMLHVAAELLNHLTTLLDALRFQCDAEDPSTTGFALAISTQVAASGLLQQQLPAALKTAQQQLQSLKPSGWCGNPCPFCQQGVDKLQELGLQLADMGAHSPQHALLELCSKLLAFWPGSLGACGSAAVGPILLPTAEFALSSLQYVCRQAGQLHTSSSSSPPQALVDLGRAALDTCAALTRAAHVV